MQEALTLCSTFLALGMHSKNPPRLCPQGRKILEERQKMSDESYPDYRMAGSPPGRLSRGEVYSLHRERGRAHGTWRGWGGHLWLPGGADGVRAPEAGGLGDEGGGGGEEGSEEDGNYFRWLTALTVPSSKTLYVSQNLLSSIRDKTAPDCIPSVFGPSVCSFLGSPTKPAHQPSAWG